MGNTSSWKTKLNIGWRNITAPPFVGLLKKNAFEKTDKYRGDGHNNETTYIRKYIVNINWGYCSLTFACVELFHFC